MGLERGSRPPAPTPAQADTLTYEASFGLSEKAFSLNADPRFIYDSPVYTAVRQNLLAGMRRREGLLVLTGQIGAGKTTLCRAVLEDLGRNTYSSLVPDPFASREDLLKMLLVDFGAVSAEELTTGPLAQASRTELGYRLMSFFAALPPEAYAVVMIDEAQNLSLPLIEETRLLSDTLGAQGRLQLVLVGQPELHAKLKLPEMRQVDQRICGYHRLSPLDREAVAGYITHRLAVAGGHGRELFAADIIDTIHLRSGGVPRLINRICDRALQLAFERKATRVEQDTLEAALIEVGATTLSPNWDAVMFEASPASSPAQVAPVAPAATLAPAAPEAPVPAVAPAAKAKPSRDDGENLDQDIKEWLSQELAPLARAVPPASAPSPAQRRTAPATQRTVAPRTSVKPGSRERTFTTDWPRDMRSETYMQGLLRQALKWGVVGVAGFAVVVGLISGASYLITAATPNLPPGVIAPSAQSGDTLPERATAETVVEFAAPVAPVSPFEAAMSAMAPASTVAAAAVSPSSPAEFMVAIGMFADPGRADRLVEILTQAGLPAMQRSVQLRQASVQQIVLGPFFSRAEAAADLKRLQALGGYNDARVIDGR